MRGSKGPVKRYRTLRGSGSLKPPLPLCNLEIQCIKTVASPTLALDILWVAKPLQLCRISHLQSWSRLLWLQTSVLCPRPRRGKENTHIQWQSTLSAQSASKEGSNQACPALHLTPVARRIKGTRARVIIKPLLDQDSLTESSLQSCCSVQFSSVQSLSRVRLFATPWISARKASLSITNSQSLLRLTPIESVMPSSHLILWRPLLLLPPIPPSIRVFSNESTLRMRQPKYSSFILLYPFDTQRNRG